MSLVLYDDAKARTFEPFALSMLTKREHCKQDGNNGDGRHQQGAHHLDRLGREGNAAEQCKVTDVGGDEVHTIGDVLLDPGRSHAG